MYSSVLKFLGLERVLKLARLVEDFYQEEEPRKKGGGVVVEEEEDQSEAVAPVREAVAEVVHLKADIKTMKEALGRLATKVAHVNQQRNIEIGRREKAEVEIKALREERNRQSSVICDLTKRCGAKEEEMKEGKKLLMGTIADLRSEMERSKRRHKEEVGKLQEEKRRVERSFHQVMEEKWDLEEHLEEAIIKERELRAENSELQEKRANPVMMTVEDLRIAAGLANEAMEEITTRLAPKEDVEEKQLADVEVDDEENETFEEGGSIENFQQEEVEADIHVETPVEKIKEELRQVFKGEEKEDDFVEERIEETKPMESETPIEEAEDGGKQRDGGEADKKTEEGSFQRRFILKNEEFPELRVKEVEVESQIEVNTVGESIAKSDHGKEKNPDGGKVDGAIAEKEGVEEETGCTGPPPENPKRLVGKKKHGKRFRVLSQCSRPLSHSQGHNK
ncbi:hypothetical protein BSKO_07939 [Bryopsis sp. KO-2023]|nr:hypothetical protein BSKO_07939 [Bryopsis sp. KO-2023]